MKFNSVISVLVGILAISASTNGFAQRANGYYVHDRSVRTTFPGTWNPRKVAVEAERFSWRHGSLPSYSMEECRRIYKDQKRVEEINLTCYDFAKKKAKNSPWYVEIKNHSFIFTGND